MLEVKQRDDVTSHDDTQARVDADVIDDVIGVDGDEVDAAVTSEDQRVEPRDVERRSVHLGVQLTTVDDDDEPDTPRRRAVQPGLTIRQTHALLYSRPSYTIGARA